jgi:hypothetical protein
MDTTKRREVRRRADRLEGWRRAVAEQEAGATRQGSGLFIRHLLLPRSPRPARGQGSSFAICC